MYTWLSHDRSAYWMFIIPHMKQKLINLWKWLRKNVLNKKMIIYVLIAELIFWSPVIITAILALVIDPWFWTATSAIMLFWAGPFTPAVPLQIALALAIKGIVYKIRKHKEKKHESNPRSIHIRNDDGDDSTITTGQRTTETDRETITTISKDDREGE